MDEAHVEHAVRLVQDDGAEFRKIEHAALDEIFDAPRRSDDEKGIAAHAAYLRIDVGAADDGDGEQSGAAGKALVFLLYLESELARGDHDKHALRAVFHDLVEEGNEERARFAGAGVRDADDVAPLDDERDRFILYRGRGRVPFLPDVVLDAGIDGELHKGVRRHELRLLHYRRFVDEARDVDAFASPGPLGPARMAEGGAGETPARARGRGSALARSKPVARFAGAPARRAGRMPARGRARMRIMSCHVCPMEAMA